MANNSQTLFVSKYRPTTIEEFFGDSKKYIDMLRTLFDLDDLNILFLGNVCSGKTTLLNIIVREYYGLSADAPLPETNILYINNLKEQGISFFRGEMKTFCQASSTIFGKKKMVIIDDIDMINEQNQQVFRNYIDKYKHNIHFVSVCTNIQKVIESFQSRVHIIRLDPINDIQFQNLYRKIVDNEKMTIDADSKEFIFKFCTTTVRTFLNHMEKIYLLKQPINLDICMKLYTDISFQNFETYVSYLRQKQLSDAIKIMYDIYDYGYSVVDIYDYFFSFTKITDKLTEDEKYNIIPILCEYITIFHSVHEDCIELAMFTNRIIDILEKRQPKDINT
jgi:DNA polymerase III delta prime subunit